MSYQAFIERVSGFVKASGSKARFSHEDGKHIARCADGVIIVGNTIADRVLVRWGSGHTAYATI